VLAELQAVGVHVWGGDGGVASNTLRGIMVGVAGHVVPPVGLLHHRDYPRVLQDSPANEVLHELRLSHLGFRGGVPGGDGFAPGTLGRVQEGEEQKEEEQGMEGKVVRVGDSDRSRGKEGKGKEGHVCVREGEKGDVMENSKGGERIISIFLSPFLARFGEEGESES